MLALANDLLDRLFPGRCPGCGAAAAGRICEACWEGMPPPGQGCPACLACRPCRPCPVREGPLAGVHVLGPYAGLIRRSVRLLKFHGRSDLARPLGRGLGRLARAVLAGPVAATARPVAGAASPINGAGKAVHFVAVPASPGRLRERGFDHVAALARWARREAGTGLWVPGAIVRARETPPLYPLSRRERASVLSGAFRAPATVSGTVFLVDDVMTTGATAVAAATVLRDAGAARVFLLAVARA